MVRSDYCMTDTQLIAVHAFASRLSMSVSVDETLFPRKVNLSTSFRELPFSVEMSPLWLKHIYSIPAATHSRLCTMVLAWVVVFARSAMSLENTKVKVCFLDRDTDYFDIVAGVLLGDTLAPYLFIICLDYVLRMSFDKMKDNGFKLTKERSRRYPAQTIMNNYLKLYNH